jgi:hypothetical protein
MAYFLSVPLHTGRRPRLSRLNAGPTIATLATRDVRHFDDLTVPVVDPWHA